jgi:hypothetical protein
MDTPISDDICGLCGNPGADKFAHPEHWPGERVPDGPLVHSDCESAPDLELLLIESQTSIGEDWRERRDAVLARIKATGPAAAQEEGAE